MCCKLYYETSIKDNLRTMQGAFGLKNEMIHHLLITSHLKFIR